MVAYPRPCRVEATWFLSVAAAGLAVFAAVGCSGGSASSSGDAAAILLVSGDSQSGTVGTELTAPLVVKVTDAAGHPVAGQLVNFRVVSGGGSVFAGSSITSTEGLAQEHWTLGPPAGVQQVEARAVDPVTGGRIVFATFTATALAGPPGILTIEAGDGQTAAQLTTLPSPIQIRVTDSFGNRLPNVAVSFTVTSGGGSADPRQANTDDAGVADSTWTLGPVIGVQTVSAEVIGLPPVTISATAMAGDVQTELQIASGWGQTATVGNALELPVVVVMKTLAGAPVSEQAIAVQVLQGGGSVTPSDPVTGADGTVGLIWTVGTVPGPQRIGVSAVDPISGKELGPVPVDASALVGPPALLVDAAVAPSSAPGISTVNLTVQDKFGNVVPGVEVSFTPGLDCGTVGPELVATAADGTVATSWTYGSLVGEQTLTVHVADVPPMILSRTLTFPQTCDGTYKGIMTATQVTYDFGFCDRDPFTMIVKDGMASTGWKWDKAGLVSSDGSFSFTYVQLTGYVHYVGSLVGCGTANALASGTTTGQGDGSFQTCSGIFSVTLQ